MSQSKEEVKRLISEMEASLDNLKAEANLFLEKGNKSAVTRARAFAQSIKGLSQDFRNAIHAAKSE